MTFTLRRTATALGALALVGASAPSAYATIELQKSQTSVATAASCYGGAVSYSKPANQPLLYAGTGQWFVTSSNCNDINVKPKTDRYMKVCFGSSASDCQANWKLAKANQWNAIATDVLNGSRYFIWFRSDAASSGQIAD